MALLTILTLLYAAVLVLALAASLIAIWVFLRRIGSTLEEVASALSTTGDRSAELATHLERLHQPCGACAEELARAEECLVRAEQRLATWRQSGARTVAH